MKRLAAARQLAPHGVLGPDDDTVISAYDGCPDLRATPSSASARDHDSIACFLRLCTPLWAHAVDQPQQNGKQRRDNAVAFVSIQHLTTRSATAHHHPTCPCPSAHIPLPDLEAGTGTRIRAVDESLITLPEAQGVAVNLQFGLWLASAVTESSPVAAADVIAKTVLFCSCYREP
ncbi:hypothetical protein CMQ_4541 [Grosmannia clavigera kw1407]|uniref:Uncharacterized protein n=1 Tax=Grosmannia clavigera (strain kw1407 / UAMH 11150) TaxID=655863 RepID=F0XUB6_GROCL|nr:uncharacterized protein CMQ_4541 [Grosmannia clavigera kw1407]EFW98689.1 hypothetical protein CMQ_4541 [Grosmannia clavigera kw1407]